jgi:hypothetical protein
MSDEVHNPARPAATQTTANIRLAGQFLHELIDSPSRLDEISDGATLVLLPPDDPELAAANLDLAARLTGVGQGVTLARVGIPVPDHPNWAPHDLRTLRMRGINVRWVADANPRDLNIVYDHQRDLLLIDFFAGRYHGNVVPRGPSLYLLIDPGTGEAFGYLMRSFLAHAVRRTPRLAVVLAAAELRPLTAEELGGLDVLNDEDVEEDPVARVRPEDVASFLSEFANRIA